MVLLLSLPASHAANILPYSTVSTSFLQVLSFRAHGQLWHDFRITCDENMGIALFSQHVSYALHVWVSACVSSQTCVSVTTQHARVRDFFVTICLIHAPLSHCKILARAPLPTVTSSSSSCLSTVARYSCTRSRQLTMATMACPVLFGAAWLAKSERVSFGSFYCGSAARLATHPPL